MSWVKPPLISKTLKNQQWIWGFNARSFNIFEKKLGTRVIYQNHIFDFSKPIVKNLKIDLDNLQLFCSYFQ
jgi:hypothetical protein